MKLITDKGIMFSLDFAIAFLIILVIMLVSIAALHLIEKEQLEYLTAGSQEEDRVMLMDSLVKNPSDKNHPGLALFDAGKRRVKENQLVAIEPNGTNELKLFGLKKLWLECNEKKLLFESEQKEEDCAVLERLVFNKTKKCLLKGKFCGE